MILYFEGEAHEPSLVPRPHGRREKWPGNEARMNLASFPGHVGGGKSGLGMRLE